MAVEDGAEVEAEAAAAAEAEVVEGGAEAFGSPSALASRRSRNFLVRLSSPAL